MGTKAHHTLSWNDVSDVGTEFEPAHIHRPFYPSLGRGTAPRPGPPSKVPINPSGAIICTWHLGLRRR
jgi:hypothetical protein